MIHNLNHQGCTIFFCSHILAEVEQMCHRIGILHQGRLIDLCTIDTLRAGDMSLEDYFVARVSQNRQSDAPSRGQLTRV